MITLVEPQQYVAKLWSKPAVREGETYRLMRYVLQVDHEGKVLLHNVVTGQLVVLEWEEVEELKRSPLQFSSKIDQLVASHFLVPEYEDEHKRVTDLRFIIRKLYESQCSKVITHYTILPTTSCNARCYYCFEQGINSATMSEQTAQDVVEFISRNCGDVRKIHLSWFGGEPTVASNRINQICHGLAEKNIDFISEMTSNGYLFDPEMIDKAKNLWNLHHINISMDGVGATYNRIKAYPRPTNDPYEKVMSNIGLLLRKGIHVNIRMNFDISNYHEFELLLKDSQRRFGDISLLNMFAHQVNGEFQNGKDCIPHGNKKWFSEKIIELNNQARKIGLYKKRHPLPSLVSIGCKAAMNNTVTITPEGNLVRCLEQIGHDQITGNVLDGITNPGLVQSWKLMKDSKLCSECSLFPKCLRVQNCCVEDGCIYQQEYTNLYHDVIIRTYKKWEEKNVLSGTNN